MPRTTKPQTLADKQAAARDEKAEQAHNGRPLVFRRKEKSPQ